ncbi:tyrosine-type recombinase/integrase [Prescottella equi]|uniref:tyrosine-type recombinase/integrase n=1 Tax=Rhodococcus hoagii TaxID=43767 RepID=UPI0023DB4EEB|nr:site-specific integrase [Prescottella equi]
MDRTFSSLGLTHPVGVAALGGRCPKKFAMRPDPKPKKLPNGRWKARISIWDPVSQRTIRQLTRTFDRKWQAEDWIRESRDRTVDSVQLSALPVAAYIKQFESEALYGLRSPHTVANYRSHWRLRVVPVLGQVRIGDLDPVMIERAQDLWSVGVSRTVVMGTRNSLSRVCQHAVKRGVLAKNPVLDAAQPPREVAKEIVTLDRAEVGALVSRLNDKDALYGDLASVAVMTGVRAGELLALRPADIDVANQRIRVQRAWSGTGRQRKLGPPKSGKQRAVPVPADLIPVLERRIALVGGRADCLWVGPRGGSLRHANVLARSGFKECVTEMGHPEFRWHDLRATAIVEWIRRGVPLTVVREWAGHSSLTTTDRYARVARNDHADAVRLLDTVACPR